MDLASKTNREQAKMLLLIDPPLISLQFKNGDLGSNTSFSGRKAGPEGAAEIEPNGDPAPKIILLTSSRFCHVLLFVESSKLLATCA